jgi:hypothetical protein
VAALVLWGASLSGVALIPTTAWGQSKAKAPAAKSAQPKASEAKPEAAAADSEPSTPQAREKTLTGAKSAGSVKGQVKVEENKEGVKSYTFGAQELEGRLKSPQILYFLRRVRAQFDPSGLGHRSFMRELADTRRHRAVR